jgi:hypothetical protein
MLKAKTGARKVKITTEASAGMKYTAEDNVKGVRFTISFDW